MDSVITAAVRALAKGDVPGALNRVALRDDAAQACSVDSSSKATHSSRKLGSQLSSRRAFSVEAYGLGSVTL
jgi:hypothetical protein